ncbi:arginine transporter [Salmonella enterica]|uniref:arginine transporter n=1 Tax=Escherichia coli TaxID=562 RepID=UPI000F5FA7E8|nr:arginine transporter [Escherichia coli]EAP6665506.1 arginine transporter [Salmonella enterica]AZH37159.1 arginine transporter [Escherichia coli]EBN2045072.1 arginine transporter [Salmonella enterica]EGR8340824.1 arginine transporter [Salmonella enterica]ELK7791308.1 arginine transporter [Escherichia coli]
MKKILTSLMLTGALLSSAGASAVELNAFEGVSTDQSEGKNDAGDPCFAVMCLYGQLTGNTQKGCDPAVKAFKAIKGTKKHGIFDPTKTLRKRTQFLNGCPTADPDTVKKILNKFGRLKSF